MTTDCLSREDLLWAGPFHALHLRSARTELPSAERYVLTFIMAARNLPEADASSDMNAYSKIRLNVRHHCALKGYALSNALNVLCTVTDMNLKYVLSSSNLLTSVMAVRIAAAIIVSSQQGCILLIMPTGYINRLSPDPDSGYLFQRKRCGSSQIT